MRDKHSPCKFTDEQLEFLKDIFTPRCCHNSGEHDPTHFVSYRQKARAFDRGRELLGFGEVTVDELIPEENCYWCNRESEATKKEKT